MYMHPYFMFGPATRDETQGSTGSFFILQRVHGDFDDWVDAKEVELERITGAELVVTTTTYRRD